MTQCYPESVTLADLQAVDVDASAVFDVFSASRRRSTLAVLLKADPPVAVADLARRVAAAEWPDGDEPPTEAVADVHASLHHVHLPKMADAGVVEYRPDDDAVTVTETGAELSPFAARDVLD